MKKDIPIYIKSKRRMDMYSQLEATIEIQQEFSNMIVSDLDCPS